MERVALLPQVTEATGLANIEVEDDWMLTDELNPRQFSELAGVDIELARLLYQAYGCLLYTSPVKWNRGRLKKSPQAADGYIVFPAIKA